MHNWIHTVLVALLLSGAPSAYGQSGADSLLTASDSLDVYHLTTAADGTSRIDRMPLHLVTGKYGLKTLIDAHADRVKLGVSQNGLLMDYHVAQHRTLLIQMQGYLLVDAGDGILHRLPPGSVVLAEDRTGKGHKSGCATNTPDGQCWTMQINLDDAGSGLQPMEQ